MQKWLIVLIGPTGVGKTDLSIRLANHFGTEIISSDSRQLYHEIPIGTAAPTHQEMKGVKHHFIGTLDLTDYYSASRFEEEALNLLNETYKGCDVCLMTGGSMLYIDALCNGIDDIPTIDPQLRGELVRRFETEGLDLLRGELKLLDPEYYNEVDLMNHKRVLHALEVCLMTGKTFTSFRQNSKKERPFNILKIGLRREREELYERINKRVDLMIENGLVEEAMKVFPKKGCNSLNTVGFKELFAYFDGLTTKEEAIEKIKRNSRVYSRKQMTWFKRDPLIEWFHPEQVDEMIEYIETSINYIK